MKEETETTVVKTLTIGERELENIVKNSLGPEWEKAYVSIYQDSVPAGSVMGAIDDVSHIACIVRVITKNKT